MKFTLIRTDNNGRQFVSRQQATTVFHRMMTAKKPLRHEVYPGVVMSRQADGTLAVTNYNNVVVLTAGPMASEAQEETSLPSPKLLTSPLALTSRPRYRA